MVVLGTALRLLPVLWTVEEDRVRTPGADTVQGSSFDGLSLYTSLEEGSTEEVDVVDDVEEVDEFESSFCSSFKSYFGKKQEAKGEMSLR